MQVSISASSSHFAVLPDLVAIESYKVASVEEILRRWEIISRFPRQALVLKGTSTICGLRGRGRGIQARMIDHRQTAAFPKFCAHLKQTQSGDARYRRALLNLSTAAQQEIATISSAVPRVMESRRQLAGTYTQAEARAIRVREELPQSLKVKFVRNVCLLFWMLMRDHPRVRDLPKDFDDGCNLYLFRFALCVHIWLLEWIADGNNEQSNASLRNDLIDLHVAAYGTYFDGLMTGDDRMTYIHAMARFMHEAMRREPLPRSRGTDKEMGGSMLNQHVGLIVSGGVLFVLLLTTVLSIGKIRAFMERMVTRKIDRRRKDTLIAIREQQQEIEEMAQRAAACGEQVDDTLLNGIRSRLDEIVRRALALEITPTELQVLEEDAEYQGQLSAYLCPQREIADEGSLCLEELKEWNVPETIIDKLRETLGNKISDAANNPGAARSALRELFEEYDSWDGYTTNYDHAMNRIALGLLVGFAVSLPSAVALIRWPSSFPAAIIVAGLAGSFISILSKMPELEVALAGELSSYLRKRILNRIGVGVGASIVGSALLGWGVVSISFHGTSYADVLLGCIGNGGSCNSVNRLVFIAVPLIFGLSERALTWFESKMLGT